MTTAVCTLFEGDYHSGVAALANSLHRAGFTGVLYAGHRGPRPAWAAGGTAAAGDTRVVLVALDTSVHFTNFKPQFMRRVLDTLAPDADAVLYLDPDLCLTAPWRFIDEWIESGVALSEDVNSPLHENHPRRVGWRKFYAPRGHALRYRGAAYVNGGAVGVTRARADFLGSWETLQALMGEEIGGLDQVKLDGGTSGKMRNPFFCFNVHDQDALNATLEARADVPVSILGREAMGFAPGLRVLPHALGHRKPWRRPYLREILAGRPPGPADEAFWRHAEGPIQAWPPGLPARRRREILVARFLARFIARG
jgi:hypothetical protein